MKDTFLNHAIYSILDRIADFQVFYMEAVTWIAMTCFMMALGMAVVKIFLNACNPKEEFFKLFSNLIYYWIMIALYPTAMKAILPFAMNMGYGAVFDGGAYVISVDDSVDGVSKSGFYDWLAENSGGYFTTGEFEDDKGATKKALDLNIVDVKTGRIDLNKTWRFLLVFVQIVLKVTFECIKSYIAHPTGFLDALAGIMSILEFAPWYFIFGLLMILIGSFCFIMVLINYVMCLFDYYFMVGMGVLMIPLSLWEGTKNYTQTLLGSIGKIIIKLMVISSVMFLCIMTYVDIFVNFYVTINNKDNGVISIGLYLEMVMMCVFQGIFLYMMSQQTSAIAGFLSGGSPNLSLGEFAGAAASMAGTGAVSSAGGKAMAGMAGSAVMSAAKVGSAAAGGGIAAALAGGGAGSIAKSVMSSGGRELGGQLAGAALNAPKNISSAAQGIASQRKNIARGLGMQNAFSAEGIARFPNGGGGGGGGSGSGGGSEGGGNSTPKSSGEGTQNKGQETLQNGVKSATEGKGGGGSASTLTAKNGGGNSMSENPGGKEGKDASSHSSVPSGANPGGDIADKESVGTGSLQGESDSSSSEGGKVLGSEGGSAALEEKEREQGLHGVAGDVSPANAGQVPENDVGKYAPSSSSQALGNLGDAVSSKAGSMSVGKASDQVRQYANRRAGDGTLQGAINGRILGALANAPKNISDMRKAAKINGDIKAGKEVSAQDRAFARDNGLAGKVRGAGDKLKQELTGNGGKGVKVSFTDGDRKALTGTNPVTGEADSSRQKYSP